MVVNCHRVNDISSSLHLSPKTVNSYRYRIFEKLNVRSDVELALLAVRHGMVGNAPLEESVQRLDFAGT
jgi:DNA-binding NarL/FixJ family response regulator